IPISVTTSPSSAAAWRCLGRPEASWIENPCSAGQRSKMSPTRLARSCSICGSEARLPNSTSFMAHVPQVPGQRGHRRSAAKPCRNCYLVQGADECPATQPDERLGQLRDRLGNRARDISVHLVVLLASPSRIERDLGDEKLAAEALPIDMVGKAPLILDHDPVQVRLAAEYSVAFPLGAERAPLADVGLPVPTSV